MNLLYLLFELSVTILMTWARFFFMKKLFTRFVRTYIMLKSCRFWKSFFRVDFLISGLLQKLIDGENKIFVKEINLNCKSRKAGNEKWKMELIFFISFTSCNSFNKFRYVLVLSFSKEFSLVMVHFMWANVLKNFNTLHYYRWS